MNKVSSEEYFIDVPGGQIYLKKWTPARVKNTIPIVLLHDSLGCVDLWRNFPEALAGKLSRTVFAYDRLGFGKSSARDKLPGLEFIWDEADIYFPSIKKSASIQQYILFGHSVGGSMSIGIAASDKDCVAVITEASQAFVEDITINGIRAAKSEFQKPGAITRLEKWHGNKATWVLNAWTVVWLSPDYSSWSLEPRIGKVTCPVLALHGDQDEFGSNAFPEFICKKTAGRSQMILMEGCGHVPHKEKMQEVINSTGSFIESLSFE